MSAGPRHGTVGCARQFKVGLREDVAEERCLILVASEQGDAFDEAY